MKWKFYCQKEFIFTSIVNIENVCKDKSSTLILTLTNNTYSSAVLSIEPDAFIFNKVGNEISGTITIKNVTVDKPLSYKVR